MRLKNIFLTSIAIAIATMLSALLLIKKPSESTYNQLDSCADYIAVYAYNAANAENYNINVERGKYPKDLVFYHYIEESKGRSIIHVELYSTSKKALVKAQYPTVVKDDKIQEIGIEYSIKVHGIKYFPSLGIFGVSIFLISFFLLIIIFRIKKEK